MVGVSEGGGGRRWEVWEGSYFGKDGIGFY